MNGYVLRKGDLLCAPLGVGLVTKTTPKYIYYFFKGHTCKASKQSIWQYNDIKNRNFEIKYGSMNRRRKKRTTRTLDLHGIRHEKAEEKIRQFLNFVQLPCNIITGDSSQMKEIVSNIVEEYGWVCRRADDWNTGSLVVVEKE